MSPHQEPLQDDGLAVSLLPAGLLPASNLMYECILPKCTQIIDLTRMSELIVHIGQHVNEGMLKSLENICTKAGYVSRKARGNIECIIPKCGKKVEISVQKHLELHHSKSGVGSPILKKDLFELACAIMVKIKRMSEASGKIIEALSQCSYSEIIVVYFKEPPSLRLKHKTIKRCEIRANPNEDLFSSSSDDESEEQLFKDTSVLAGSSVRLKPATSRQSKKSSRGPLREMSSTAEGYYEYNLKNADLKRKQATSLIDNKQRRLDGIVMQPEPMKAGTSCGGKSGCDDVGSPTVSTSVSSSNTSGSQGRSRTEVEGVPVSGTSLQYLRVQARGSGEGTTVEEIKFCMHHISEMEPIFLKSAVTGYFLIPTSFGSKRAIRIYDAAKAVIASFYCCYSKCLICGRNLTTIHGAMSHAGLYCGRRALETAADMGMLPRRFLEDQQDAKPELSSNSRFIHAGIHKEIESKDGRFLCPAGSCVYKTKSYDGIKSHIATFHQGMLILPENLDRPLETRFDND